MTAREEPTDEPGLVHRRVESTDPSLSAEANELLTEELRDALGRDAVDVPRQTPNPSGQPHSRHVPLVRLLIENSVYIVSTFFLLLVCGAVVALVTGSWWVLGAAVGVHLIGTFAIAGTTMLLADETEHVSPTTAALLEDEGVADPDRLFTELIEDFGGDGGRDGDADTSSSSR